MPTASSSSTLWQTVKQDFKSLFPEDVFQLWFEPIECLESSDDHITLGVTTDFAAIWINDNYLDLIVQRLRLVAGQDVKVKLAKIAGNSGAQTPSRLPTEPVEKPARSTSRRSNNRSTEARAAYTGHLNARNTFDTFVVGSNNQMAQAAALAVSQSPAQAYNPLFLYGETGLGKTHLMHAIGHAILRQRPDARVTYLSTEKFTNEFIQGLQENALVKFRQRYRNVDVLLLDDVQFLGGKERIQEEFFHTFNDLFESGKQIVLSSDRRASEISKLESRLVSRFEWGLPADIQAPDFETRVAILRTKAASLKLEVPADVINFIAQHISKNIRRLEGALIKVSSYSSLTGNPLDLAVTEKLLQDVLMEQAQNMLTMDMIQKKVADHYQILHSDMTSKRRPNNIAIPRQIAMYLSRNLTKHSLQEIGNAFGGRDHGTVIHACKAVDNMMDQDQTARSSIEFLRNQLSR